MNNPKVQTLIETVELTQNLLVYYLSLLKEEDPHRVFQAEGQNLNSVYWLVGHLAWAENMLILQGTHGKPEEYAWLEVFKFGAEHEVYPDYPFDVLKEGAKAIHQKAMAHLATLQDEDLNKLNALNFGFGKEPTNQLIIMHFIRHLGTHIGHLSWLCKMYGVKTV